jgi:hypothetical protein
MVGQGSRPSLESAAMTMARTAGLALAVLNTLSACAVVPSPALMSCAWPGSDVTVPNGSPMAVRGLHQRSGRPTGAFIAR